jgi:predicted AAA+ superfamily ATPase
LAHYLELLSGAGLLTGLSKYSTRRVRQRGSSPKLQVLNTALLSATSGMSFAEAREDRDRWGRLVESAVGAHLLNSSAGEGIELFYWRERNREVDFVLKRGKNVVAIEVASGARKGSLPGLQTFAQSFHPRRVLLVGGQGIPLEEFFRKPAATWLD